MSPVLPPYRRTPAACRITVARRESGPRLPARSRCEPPGSAGFSARDRSSSGAANGRCSAVPRRVFTRVLARRAGGSGRFSGRIAALKEQASHSPHRTTWATKNASSKNFQQYARRPAARRRRHLTARVTVAAVTALTELLFGLPHEYRHYPHPGQPVVSS